MFFRQILAFRDLGLKDGQALPFSDGKIPAVTLTIRQPLIEDEPTLNDRECLCTIETEEPTSAKVEKQFADTVESEQKLSWRGEVPQAVRDTFLRANSRMTEFSRRVAKVIRWRIAIPGNHNPVRWSRVTNWSVDGKIWTHVPGETHGEWAMPKKFSPLDEQRLSSINQLLGAGFYEPLAHELLREARLQDSNNRRSSLIIAIAAAEVGFKSLVGWLVPHAEWLAHHVPSPPLVAMLEKYLPTLPVRAHFTSDPSIKPFVPKEMIGVLKKGILLRNEATHIGGSVSPQSLKEILHTVEDLLYLFDFYSGQVWAMDHFSQEALLQLQEITQTSQ